MVVVQAAGRRVEVHRPPRGQMIVVVGGGRGDGRQGDGGGGCVCAGVVGLGQVRHFVLSCVSKGVCVGGEGRRRLGEAIDSAWKISEQDQAKQ